MGYPFHPQEHNTLIFTNASNQGWGAHFQNMTVSGNWTDQEKLLHINVLELKAVFLALKSFQNRILDKSVLIATDNATVVSYLNKQGGTHSWDMCLLVWHILAYCNPRNILIRARHIQGCLNVIAHSSLQEGQNNSNRMVTSSSNIQPNLHSLAQTNVCHQIESQTTNLCLTSPRFKCCEHRCFEHLLGGSGRLCLLSCNSHTKGHTENVHLQVQNDSSSTRVAQNALVSSESVNQAPLQLPHWPHLLKQPFSQKFHQNLMYLNMHVWHLDTTQNHLNHSLSRWQIEFRHLKDPHLEDSRSQGGLFLNSGANRTRWSAQSLLSQT